jgi:hypothetical protein
MPFVMSTLLVIADVLDGLPRKLLALVMPPMRNPRSYLRFAFANIKFAYTNHGATCHHFGDARLVSLAHVFRYVFLYEVVLGGRDP